MSTIYPGVFGVFYQAKYKKFTRTFTYCFAYPRVALAYPLQKYLLIYLVTTVSHRVTTCHTKLGETVIYCIN